jgi:hypothetical protein
LAVNSDDETTMTRIIQGIEEESKSEDETELAPIIQGIEEESKSEEETALAPIIHGIEESELIDIDVKDHNGKTFSLRVDASETIGSVKARIQDMEGMPSIKCQLVFSGKLLVNDRTVGSYGIRRNDTVNMFVPLGGGGKRGRTTAEGVAQKGRSEDKATKLRNLKDKIMTDTIMARIDEYLTEDTVAVLNELAGMDNTMQRDGALNTMMQRLRLCDSKDIKDLVSALETTNVESKFIALSNCVNKTMLQRLEAKKRGYDKLMSIARDTCSYLATEAMCDKTGHMAWTSLSDMLLNLVEAKGREAGIGLGGVRDR